MLGARQQHTVRSDWHAVFSPQSRKEPVRFGSVRKMFFPGPTRFGLRFSDASWLGPVRCGSFPRTVPAGSGMVRFGLAG